MRAKRPRRRGSLTLTFAGPSAQGGTVPWNPVTGVSTMTLVARYRADLITGLWTDSARTIQVSADTDPVGAADDPINSSHLTYLTDGANRPIYRTLQQNNLPGIVFNGVNQFLQRAFAMFDGGKHAIFIVLKTPTTPNGDIIFDTATDAAIDRRSLSVTTSGLILSRDGGGGSITNNGFTDGDTLLFSGLLMGSDSRTRINNAAEVTGNISADITDSTSPFRIGTRYTTPGADQYWQGTLYEALFYSVDPAALIADVLTDMDYVANGPSSNGLLAKWGL